MKTQLRKPARERARYTEEYKREALELWRNSGRSAAQVAAELGIRAPLLYRWARTERPSGTSAPGQKRLLTVEQLEAIRPDLDGNAIMELLGLPPGPLVGKAWRHLKELRLERGPLEHDEAVAELHAWARAQGIEPAG